ncbi:MAG: LPS-assembly protein LptD [Paracoccaceae bacterium]
MLGIKVRLSFFFFSIFYAGIFSSVFSDSKLNLVADEINFSRDNQRITATGNVQIISDTRQLFAEKLIYDKKSDQVTVFGPIEILYDSGVKLFAQSSVISSDLKTSIIREVRAIFENSFEILSEEIQQKPNGVTEFKQSMGTSCKICNGNKRPPIWNVRSKSIYHNQKEKSLVFRDAWLELGGIPVFYTPYIRTPEPGVRRASGLLTPSIISSDLLGFGIKQPYFLVLSPFSDLTISLLKTNQTTLIEGEFRLLSQDEKLNLKGVIEPNLSEEPFKGFIHTQGTKSYKGKINFTYDLTLLKNKKFLMKYGYDERDLISNTLSFTRFLEYRADKLEAYYFQSLRTPAEKEPLLLPNFSSQRLSSMNSKTLFLSHKTSLVGLIETDKKLLRINNSFNVHNKTISKKGFLFRSSASLSGSIYKIWNSENSSSKHLTFYPVFSSDLSFPMIRMNKSRKEIIIPRIQLVYSPNYEVSKLINEDSIQVDFDRTNLFSTNRFPGLDLQESGIWVNSSVKYQNEFDKNKSFGAEIGQVNRFTEFNQFSPGSGLKGTQSDFLFSGFFKYSDLVRVTNSLLMNNKFKLRKSDTNLSIRTGRSTVNGNLLYSTLLEDDPKEDKVTELTISSSSQIDNNWRSLFDVRHDLSANKTISTSVGLTFENECVDFNFNVSKRFGSSDYLPEDTRFEISFDLGGFGQKKQKTTTCTRKLNL